MKLEASKGFSLEWEGTEYTLRKPRVKESILFAKQFNQYSEDQIVEKMDAAIEHLDNLGLPRAVAEEMEMSHITAIQNLLNGVDSQGK